VTDHGIRLPALWGREVLRGWALWTTPITLPDEEYTSYHPEINISSSLVDNLLFGLNHSACLALVIYSKDLGAELEGLASGGGWEGLEQGDETLAIYNPMGVKFWHAGDGCRALAGVKIDNLSGGTFEG
jgi:hypothetical protein